MRSLSEAANSSLNRAKKNKHDEFYTGVADISREILGSGRYDGCFEGKIVAFNCNDMGKNGFPRFFIKHFGDLGLKELLIVSYGENAMVEVYDGKEHTDRFRLSENGDFRSSEGTEILRHADIVCTNPPFSLFRVFLKELTEEDKDFLIVGNINEMLCKDIFPMFMDGRIRYGAGTIKTFYTPDGNEKFGNIGWYTNIGTVGKPESLQLEKKFNQAAYPVYDNYPAISVDRVKDIPCDYLGAMGVPASYLLRHDPNQFELIGTSSMLAGEEWLPDGTVKKNPGRFYLNGRRLYERVVIKRKRNDQDFPSLQFAMADDQ